jgi:hypothetical protein
MYCYQCGAIQLAIRDGMERCWLCKMVYGDDHSPMQSQSSTLLKEMEKEREEVQNG